MVVFSVSSGLGFCLDLLVKLDGPLKGFVGFSSLMLTDAAASSGPELLDGFLAPAGALGRNTNGLVVYDHIHWIGV